MRRAVLPRFEAGARLRVFGPLSLGSHPTIIDFHGRLTDSTGSSMAGDSCDTESSPMIGDYRQTRQTSAWETARKSLDGLPGGAINIAHEAVDRHADGPRGNVPALRCNRSGRRDDRAATAQRRSADVIRLWTTVIRCAGQSLGRRPERMSKYCTTS